MKKHQIFIGDIRKCTKHIMQPLFSFGDPFGGEIFGYTEQEDELYKKDAVLIEVTNGAYVDLEVIDSALDMLRLKKYILKDGGWRNNSLMMSTRPTCGDELFVDSDSLKPYYNKEQDKNVSVKQLKKEIKQK